MYPSFHPILRKKSKANHTKAFVHVNDSRKWMWDTSFQSEMPVLATTFPQKRFKTSSGYLSTYIYLFITGCVISVSVLNTMKIISILSWLLTYSFHATYESVFFTAFLKIWITRMICFCFQLSREAFSWYHRHLSLAVIKVSFSETRMCKLQWKLHVTNIINVS